eukprot:gene18773-20664_t
MSSEENIRVSRTLKFGRAEYYRMTTEKMKVILFDNLQRGDVHMTKQLLHSCRETVDLDAIFDKAGSSLLHVACSRGHLDSVKVLIEAGASLQTVDSSGSTALHITSTRSDVETTKFLLKHGADAMKKNFEGDLPLDVAATLEIALVLVEKMIALGHKELIKDYLQPLKLKKITEQKSLVDLKGQSLVDSILSRNLKPGEERMDCETQAQTGCRFRLSNVDDNANAERNRNIYESSSDEGDDMINTTTQQERRYTFPSSMSTLLRPRGSILKRSASIGEYTTVMESSPREEIEKPSIRAVTFPSDILCQVCIMDNDYKDLKRLILADEIRDVDKLYANGISPLHLAVIEGRHRCAEVLIDCGANVENKDPHGWTPLHAAVVSCNIKSIKLLCKRGANLCATTNNGETVFDLAETDLIRKYLKMMTIRLVLNPNKHYPMRRINSY